MKNKMFILALEEIKPALTEEELPVYKMLADGNTVRTITDSLMVTSGYVRKVKERAGMIKIPGMNHTVAFASDLERRYNELVARGAGERTLRIELNLWPEYAKRLIEAKDHFLANTAPVPVYVPLQARVQNNLEYVCTQNQVSLILLSAVSEVKKEAQKQGLALSGIEGDSRQVLRMFCDTIRNSATTIYAHLSVTRRRVKLTYCIKEST